MLLILIDPDSHGIDLYERQFFIFGIIFLFTFTVCNDEVKWIAIKVYCKGLQLLYCLFLMHVAWWNFTFWQSHIPCFKVRNKKDQTIHYPCSGPIGQFLYVGSFSHVRWVECSSNEDRWEIRSKLTTEMLLMVWEELTCLKRERISAEKIQIMLCRY